MEKNKCAEQLIEKYGHELSIRFVTDTIIENKNKKFFFGFIRTMRVNYWVSVLNEIELIILKKEDEIKKIKP